MTNDHAHCVGIFRTVQLKSIGILHLFIHLLDLCLVVLVEHAPLDLQRIGQLAALQREVMGQQGEALHLLVVGQLLLQGVYALHHHLMDLLVLTEVFSREERDVVLAGILLQQ